MKLVSHKCHLWFGQRWCNGYNCLSGTWEVRSDWGDVKGTLPEEREGGKELTRLWAPEVEECGSKSEMIPRSKSFRLTPWSLTCTSTCCCQNVQLLEDNKGSDDGIVRFMTLYWSTWGKEWSFGWLFLQRFSVFALKSFTLMVLF